MFLITFSCFEGYSQNRHQIRRDSTYRNHAMKYINFILGSEYVEEKLNYAGIYHHTLSMVLYETKESKNDEGRNTIIIFFKTMTFDVDSQITIIDKEFIDKCNVGDSTCNLAIGKDRAIYLAREEGLKQGLENWKPQLVLYGGDFKNPQWTIQSKYSQSTGETVNIKLYSGESRLTFWMSIE